MFQVLYFKTVIKDNERGLLYRNGVFQRLLEPGEFKAFDPSRKFRVEKHNVVRDIIDSSKALLLEKMHPDLAAKHFTIVQPGPGEVVLVSLDGEAKYLTLPNTTRVYWKTITHVETETINVSDTFKVARKHLERLSWVSAKTILNEIIAQHEVGLLFIDGELKEELKPGRHAFWAVERDVRVAKVDQRPQSLEVTAQEILTKDRIGIRVTLTAFYKVIDAARSVAGSQDLDATLYRLVQFAIREAVATRTLDDILSARDKIDNQVRDFVTKRAGELGVKIGEIGVKDVILPGDVRELLNKVVEAERTAKANLIRRQEETAATRSLLNTSKLMQDNPLLLRLKELEALEKLVEKVGRIDLHAGQGGAGFDALLSGLYRLNKDDGDE